MKRTPVILIALAIVIAILSFPSHLNAQKFEGTVEFTVTTDQGTMPMTYMIKGGDVRVEMEGRPGMKAIFLIDAKENKTIMVIDAMKMYMESPVPQLPDTGESKVTFKKTGKTQKLLGYDCEEYLVTDGEHQTSVWITDKLGTFELFRMGGGRQRSRVEAWQKEIGNKGGFPLLAVTKSGDKEVSTFKATKVEQKSLDEALFKIPEGYQKMDQSMMRRPRQ